jgi:predicted choloylglycine hydrolase
VTSLPLTLTAVAEGDGSRSFAERFAATWPAYRAWFAQAGDAARPSFVAARAALREHMPELVPTWERLCRLGGGGDQAARLLAHWCPPPHLSGCTQAVVRRGEPVLVRNYDYDIRHFDGTILHTRYGQRRVIGTGDCVWGLLDGLNEDGLGASLTFGGSRTVGDGFGISIVMRYVLETCVTVSDALAALGRVPVHMAYNVTLLDRDGDAATAYIGPDRALRRVDERVVTNHQHHSGTDEFARVSHSQERADALAEALDTDGDEEAAIRAFLAEPVYNRNFSRQFGTLYTAVIRPSAGCVDYRWPSSLWRQSFDGFTPGEHTVPLRSA